MALAARRVWTRSLVTARCLVGLWISLAGRVARIFTWRSARATRPRDAAERDFLELCRAFEELSCPWAELKPSTRSRASRSVLCGTFWKAPACAFAVGVGWAVAAMLWSPFLIFLALGLPWMMVLSLTLFLVRAALEATRYVCARRSGAADHPPQRTHRKQRRAAQKLRLKFAKKMERLRRRFLRLAPSEEGRAETIIRAVLVFVGIGMAWCF